MKKQIEVSYTLILCGYFMPQSLRTFPIFPLARKDEELINQFYIECFTIWSCSFSFKVVEYYMIYTATIINFNSGLVCLLLLECSCFPILYSFYKIKVQEKMTWESLKGKQGSSYYQVFLRQSVVSHHKIFLRNIGTATFIGYFQIKTWVMSQFISNQLICLGLLCIRDLRQCEFSFSFALGERDLKTQFKSLTRQVDC